MFKRLRNFVKRLTPNKTINRMKETKDQVTKIRDLKNKISSLESEREAYRQKEKGQRKENKQIEVEAEEAKRAKMAELEWANALDDGDFNTNIIPESVLEKLDQKNENWDGSEMVTVKREILLKAVKEDVKQQDPFRANRSRLNQKRKPKQQPTYSVEDDDFDIDNIPF